MSDLFIPGRNPLARAMRGLPPSAHFNHTRDWVSAIAANPAGFRLNQNHWVASRTLANAWIASPNGMLDVKTGRVIPPSDKTALQYIKGGWQNVSGQSGHFDTGNTDEPGDFNGDRRIACVIIGEILNSSDTYKNLVQANNNLSRGYNSFPESFVISVSNAARNIRPGAPERVNSTFNGVDGKPIVIVASTQNGTGTSYLALRDSGNSFESSSGSTIVYNNPYFRYIVLNDAGTPTSPNSFRLYAIFNLWSNFTESEVAELRDAPWVFIEPANQTPFMVGVPGVAPVPVLSNIEATGITQTSVTPQVDITFP